MARGQEETSMSGRPGGHLQATPSASNIISYPTMEELMAYCEVPDIIDLVNGRDGRVYLGWRT